MELTTQSRPIPEIIVPEFREWLAEVGKPSGKTAEQVYALWHGYCEKCQNFDQSPVQSEFLDWYGEELSCASAN